MKKILINEIGNIYGKLTVIEQRGRDSRKEALWYCRCTCGKYTIARGDGLRSGKRKSCGCSRRKPRGIAHRNQLFSNYRLGAIRRELDWDLSLELFSKLISQNCYYCGTSPTPPSSINLKKFPTGPISFNGLDRVDNRQGYTVGNIVACCKDCNYAKGTRSISQFKKWVQRIYSNWGRL